MSKFYRVTKDNFMWDKGAILKYDASNGSDGGYEAVSDLWDAVEIGLDGEYISARIVEKSPDWFERVYEVSVLGKAQYLAKNAAKEAYDKLHKEKK